MSVSAEGMSSPHLGDLARSAVDAMAAAAQTEVVGLWEFALAGERLVTRLLAGHGLHQDLLDDVARLDWSLSGLAAATGDAWFFPYVAVPRAPALIVCLGRPLGAVADAGVAIVRAGCAAPAMVLAATRADPPAIELAETCARYEWNVSRVARVLGVTRMTIYNRLRRAGVTRQRVGRRPDARRAPVAVPAPAVGA